MASPSKTTSEAEISPEFVEMVGFDQNVDRAIESNESIVDEPYSFSKFMAFFVGIPSDLKAPVAEYASL